MKARLITVGRAIVFVLLALILCGIIFQFAGYSSVEMFRSIADGAILNPGAWGRDLVIPTAEDGTGSFDHVAFRGDDFGEMRARLVAAGVAFKERVVPGGRLSQLFVPDPEGVLVEINFKN